MRRASLSTQCLLSCFGCSTARSQTLDVKPPGSWPDDEGRLRELRWRRLKSSEYRPYFFDCENRKIGRDFGSANHERPRCPQACLVADGVVSKIGTSSA